MPKGHSNYRHHHGDDTSVISNATTAKASNTSTIEKRLEVVLAVSSLRVRIDSKKDTALHRQDGQQIESARRFVRSAVSKIDVNGHQLLIPNPIFFEQASFHFSHRLRFPHFSFTNKQNNITL